MCVKKNLHQRFPLDIVQVTNGEGYKKTNDIAINDDGKAYLAMVSITPLDGLCIAGYVRHLVTNDAEAGNNYNRYFGTSLFYSFRQIRMGASFAMAEVSTMTPPAADPTVVQYRLIDAFVMTNLGSLTGVPVLLAGRYVLDLQNTMKAMQPLMVPNRVRACGRLEKGISSTIILGQCCTSRIRIHIPLIFQKPTGRIPSAISG